MAPIEIDIIDINDGQKKYQLKRGEALKKDMGQNVFLEIEEGWEAESDREELWVARAVDGTDGEAEQSVVVHDCAPEAVFYPSNNKRVEIKHQILDEEEG